MRNQLMQPADTASATANSIREQSDQTFKLSEVGQGEHLLGRSHPMTALLINKFAQQSSCSAGKVIGQVQHFRRQDGRLSDPLHVVAGVERFRAMAGVHQTAVCRPRTHRPPYRCSAVAHLASNSVRASFTCCQFCATQSTRPCIGRNKLRPRVVSSYSTRGGTSGNSSLVTNPSRSKFRSVTKFKVPSC